MARSENDPNAVFGSCACCGINLAVCQWNKRNKEQAENLAELIKQCFPPIKASKKEARKMATKGWTYDDLSW